ncbi:hypothetical protein EPN83_02980 [Patescibacteria group bacterium]|nr:MAG: hypothetical protein EPN83_02980 [Patescibacteria group bacterium]
MKHLLRTIAGLTLMAFIFSSHFSALLALEDQFEISLTVTSTDVTAPSTPTGLTATAISSSQIDLSWTASTDNVGVTSYRVYRDNALVANPSTTSYSDTGLTAATTYAYAVSALDAAGNESARSATSSATTLSAAVPGGGVGTTRRLAIFGVAVTPELHGATITWQTNLDALGTVEWGNTTSYELGGIASSEYLTLQSAHLGGLSAGTTYYFRIRAIDSVGREAFFTDTLTTLPLPEGLPNPSGFTAVPRESDILLSWRNPQISFDALRLVRSKTFYPADPFDGEVIYEGRGEQFVDTDVERGIRYYYTIFTRGRDGSYSSGAVADARIPLPGEPPERPKEIFERLPKAPAVHPRIADLTFRDFDFIQNGRKREVVGDTVNVDGSLNLTVALAYERVPEVLKTIVISLVSPGDPEKQFSFLLRVNKDKTRYEATIAPLGVSGTYVVRIAVVDYKNQGLKKIEGLLLATVLKGIFPRGWSFQGIRKFMVDYFWLLVLLLFLLALLVEFIRTVLKKRQVVPPLPLPIPNRE